jgi:superfamily II DNA or RNA helicase
VTTASLPPVPDGAVRDAIAQLVAYVREHGRISKEQILRRWPLLDDHYGWLAAVVASEHPDVVRGPRRLGGFRLRDPKPRREPRLHGARYDTDVSAGLTPDQVAAAERLAVLLTHAELERFVDRKLLNAHRAIAKAAGAPPPSFGKPALAAILIARLGEDLLSNSELRQRIARAAGIEPVARWHPGKGTAIAFAREAGFPAAFAGTASDRAADDTEWLRGHVALPALADFQEEVLQTATEKLERARWPRAIITLPTGAGKTRTAVEYTVRLHQQRLLNTPCTTLWIAHTAELLEQAIESFRQVWSHAVGVPELRLARRFGNHGRGADADAEILAAAGREHQLIVATPQRLLNDVERWQALGDERLEDWLASVELLVVDEAHRAAAPQYQRVIGLFESAAGDDRGDEPRILGLTATPFRNEYLRDYPELGTKELYTLFRQIAAPTRTLGDEPRVTLQARRILACPVEERIDTGETLRVRRGDRGEEPGSESIEAIDRALAELADDARRRGLVFEHLLPLAQDPANRVIYFGPTVDDAEIVSVLLRAQGVPTGFVSGGTRAPQRRRTIDQFRRGELRVLCNCEVLTTGFDAPQVTHVVIARPTVSHVLFEQMVGRGLRGPRFGGTESCRVLYFVDQLDIDSVRLGFNAWRRIWGLD